MLLRCSSTWLHALPFVYSIPWPSRPNCSSKNFTLAMATSVRIAIVGDIHDDWSLEEDAKALQVLKPDLVLFTGDMGNENVDLVRSISKLEFAKAIILGNHDAWGTQKFSSREKDAVQLQLECLGNEHVGFRRIDFPNLKLSVVGGRPFSCGGSGMFRKKLLIARYGVRDMDESAKRIYQVASGAPTDHSVVVLAHNGPTGLGSNVDDICGRDWFIEGGDHGDPDLAQALSQVKESTELPIPLVVFGHMHKALYRNGLRKMLVVGDDKTVYLNGAIVPRVKPLSNKEEVNTSSNSSSSSSNEGTLRVFTIADIINGSLEYVAETWVSVVGDTATVESEDILFSKVIGLL